MRARIVLLCALLAGLSLGLIPPPAGVPTAAASGEECVYGNGHFSGDCYFVQSPSGQYSCNVDYAAHTYTQGCFATPFNPGTNSAYWSATQENSKCDTVQGGWFCPGVLPPKNKYVEPGWTCDNLTNTNKWDCWPAGPPADVTDCTIPTATGVDVSISCKKTPDYVAPPSPSPSPSVPPCGDGVGANLICNGTFDEAPLADSGVTGAWYNRASEDVGCAKQYGYVRPADGTVAVVGGPTSCNRAWEMLDTTTLPGSLFQGVVVGGGDVPHTWHLEFRASTGSAQPANYQWIGFDVSLIPKNATWTDNAGQLVAISGGGSCVQAESYNGIGGHLGGGQHWALDAGADTRIVCDFVTNNTAVPNWNLIFSYANSGAANQSGFLRVDDVLLTVSYASQPPIGGGGSEGGKPGAEWDCQDDPNDPTLVNCTPPPPASLGGAQGGNPGPSPATCVQQGAQLSCDGPAPVASPAPSGSPGPGGPGATPVSYGPSPGPSPGPSADGNKPCERAEQLLAARIAQGVPYCWGSRDPDMSIIDQGFDVGDLCPQGYGLDCSGAVIWGWRQAGVDVPNATAQDLYNQLPHIACTLADLDRGATDGGGCWAIGDLIFLAHDAGAGVVYHVAGYAGGNLWTDCFNTATGCRVWDIRAQGVYSSDFRGAARPSLAWGGGQCGDGGTVAGGAGAAGAQGVSTGAIGAAMQGLYKKEPAGMLLDTANYMQAVMATFQNPDTSVVPLSSDGVGGPASAAFGGISGASVLGGVTWFFDWLADALEAAGYGPINGLLLVRLSIDIALVALVFVSIRRSVTVTA